MAKIKIVGLGAGAFEHLSLGAWQALKQSNNIFFRTETHPVIRNLKEEGIKFSTFDYLYNEKDDFSEVYQEIVNTVTREAVKHGEIVYAVPGHPCVAETTVTLLQHEAAKTNIELVIIPSMSFLDVMYATLGIDPNQGILVLDALNLSVEQINPTVKVIITQVYDRFIASEVKLNLLERYEAEHKVIIIRAAGIKNEERIQALPLCQLDHIEWFDHLCSIYIDPATEYSCLYPLDPLINVMDKLLGPNGCPWDLEQNHQSLRPYVIEEAYEVLEAIQMEDMYKLCEELGDLLLQVVFHATLAKNRQDFTIEDVIRTVTEKMIRRHPHVFGGVQVANSSEVLRNWDNIKKSEKKDNETGSVLSTITKGLPALLYAEEIQKKASKVGFDWLNWEDAWKKVEEELKELKEAYKCEKKEKIEEELGDFLFATVNVARFFKVNPEIALIVTINKFIRRFNYIEQKIEAENRSISETSLKEMDMWWEEAKNIEKHS